MPPPPIAQTKNEILKPKKGLVVGVKWANLIVDGHKPWELRKTATKIRGDFALLAKGTFTAIGKATLKECLGPLDQAALMAGRHLACETEAEIAQDVKDGYIFAWVLENAVRFPEPISYRHPSGAVTWVNLPHDWPGLK